MDSQQKNIYMFYYPAPDISAHVPLDLTATSGVFGKHVEVFEDLFIPFKGTSWNDATDLSFMHQLQLWSPGCSFFPGEGKKCLAVR